MQIKTKLNKSVNSPVNEDEAAVFGSQDVSVAAANDVEYVQEEYLPCV